MKFCPSDLLGEQGSLHGLGSNNRIAVASAVSEILWRTAGQVSNAVSAHLIVTGPQVDCGKEFRLIYLHFSSTSSLMKSWCRNLRVFRNLRDHWREVGWLEYADDIVLLFGDVQEAQSVLDKLTSIAPSFGMRFAPSKCKAMFLDVDFNTPLKLQGEILEVVDQLCQFWRKFIKWNRCTNLEG